MAETSQKITAKIDNSLIEHFYISNYVSEKEVTAIKKRIAVESSIVVGFHDEEDKILFCAVFDFESDCLHVREVAGFFGKLHDLLDIFAQALAKFLQKKYISFKTEKRAVAKWAAGNDYIYSAEVNEYRKALH